MRKIQRRSKSTVQLIQKIRNIIISIVYLGVVIGSSFLFADPQLGLVIGIVLFFLLLPLYATARAWLNYLKKKRFHRRLIEAQKP